MRNVQYRFEICKPYHIHKISLEKPTKLDEKSLLNILQKKIK